MKRACPPQVVRTSEQDRRLIAELCREHDISESLLRRWRERALEAGMERFAAGEQRTHGAGQRKRIAELERALGRELPSQAPVVTRPERTCPRTRADPLLICSRVPDQAAGRAPGGPRISIPTTSG
jgi:transposase-like protein